MLVVEAAEGAAEQCQLHAGLAQFMGIRHVIVAVNKMDLVGFDEGRFAVVARRVRDTLERVGVGPSVTIPVVARDGDNLSVSSPRMPWYDGPTMLEAMLGSPVNVGGAEGAPRFPVQDIYAWDGHRIIVGRVESGRLRAGDRLVFSPSGMRVRIRSI